MNEQVNLLLGYTAHRFHRPVSTQKGEEKTAMDLKIHAAVAIDKAENPCDGHTNLIQDVVRVSPLHLPEEAFYTL
jgi:hypothetical protein